MERERALTWLKDWRVLILCAGCIFAGFLPGMLIFGSPWHLPPAWGDIPTWITGIATAGLLVGAIVTAYYARKAFLGQGEQLTEQRKINAKQTEVLELQAAELRESIDQRKREAEQRHRAQAARVFIVQGSDQTVSLKYLEREGAQQFVTATVVNAGDQPIYDAEFRWHLGTASHGEPNPDPIGTIMPGAEASRTRKFPYPIDMDISGAVVRFTDANNVRWLRRPDGYLKEFR